MADTVIRRVEHVTKVQDLFLKTKKHVGLLCLFMGWRKDLKLQVCTSHLCTEQHTWITLVIDGCFEMAEQLVQIILILYPITHSVFVIILFNVTTSSGPPDKRCVFTRLFSQSETWEAGSPRRHIQPVKCSRKLTELCCNYCIDMLLVYAAAVHVLVFTTQRYIN